MKKSFSIIIACIFVFSCNSDEAENIPIDAITIAKNNLYGNGAEGIDKQNMVIDNNGSWNDLIDQMNMVNNVSDSFLETNIDFSKFTVIAVFDHLKPNGGHIVKLDISSNSERILVVISDEVPSGDDTLVITQPFHIVKILKTERPIVFDEIALIEIH